MHGLGVGLNSKLILEDSQLYKVAAPSHTLICSTGRIQLFYTIIWLCVCVHAHASTHACVCACGGQRSVYGVFRSCPVWFLRQGLSQRPRVHWLGLADWIANIKNLPVSTSPTLGLQTYAAMAVLFGLVWLTGWLVFCFLCLLLGIELRPLYSHCKHFANSAISQNPIIWYLRTSHFCSKRRGGLSSYLDPS